MIPAETWYETHDGELLAIVEAFKTWRQYLEGCKHEVLILTNHNNLCWSMDIKSLSSRQVWWAQELSWYHFQINYCWGKANGAANALSRLLQKSLEKEKKLWAENTQILLVFSMQASHLFLPEFGPGESQNGMLELSPRYTSPTTSSDARRIFPWIPLFFHPSRKVGWSNSQAHWAFQIVCCPHWQVQVLQVSACLSWTQYFSIKFLSAELTFFLSYVNFGILSQLS